MILVGAGSQAGWLLLVLPRASRLVAVGYIIYRSGGVRPPKMWLGRMIDPGDDRHFSNDRWGRRR